jgi:hypothetical protein
VQKFFRQLSEPLRSIQEQIWDFLIWCLVAIVVGLIGFWLPIILLATDPNAPGVGGLFHNLIDNGHLATFSIVLLAESVAGVIIALRAGSNVVAGGMRSFFSLAAVLVTFIQAGILTRSHLSEGPNHTSISFQLVLTGLAILLASYLYCLRSTSWEQDVATVKDEEQHEVETLGESAKKKTVDDGGIKL